MFRIALVGLLIGLGLSAAAAEPVTGTYTVQVSREGSGAFQPVPVLWNLSGRDSLNFHVAEPVSYEISVTTIHGKVVRSIRGTAHEGWQSFDLSAANQPGACILRIKVGCQLVVAGKILWPAAKV